MIDDPVLLFLCEEYSGGNIGYLSAEFIRLGIGRSKSGSFQKCLRLLVLRGLLKKGIELDIHRTYIYRISDGVYKKWLKQQK